MPFVAGSECEAEYQTDERAYGHDVTCKNRRYEGETRANLSLLVFRTTRNPITNAQYSAFGAATGHAVPPSIVRPRMGIG